MPYNYPYGDTSQLNLDWILKSWRTFQSQVEAMIAPQYSDSAMYPENSVVIYDHVLYTNPEEITDAEEFTPEHWSPTSITEIMGGA